MTHIIKSTTYSADPAADTSAPPPTTLAAIAQVVASARESVRAGNWHAALAVALTLPDLCGLLDTGDGKNKTRYLAWFETWLADKYKKAVGSSFMPIVVVFLSGADAYALRCSMLHEASSELQGATRTLATVRFVYADQADECPVHLTRVGGTVYLDAARLVEDFCEATLRWSDSAQSRQEVQARAQQIVQFLPASSVPLGENNMVMKGYANRAEAEADGVFFPEGYPFDGS